MFYNSVKVNNQFLIVYKNNEFVSAVCTNMGISYKKTHYILKY